MTHADSCIAEGEYLLALPAIRATGDLDDSVIDALLWRDIETLSSYCLDRSSDMPAGCCCNLGAGAQQLSCSEAGLVAAQRWLA